MISKKKHPAGWAELMYELEDAQEHLGRLVAEMQSYPDYSEGNFRVDLGHVYSHLNRAWHCRDAEEGLPESAWQSAGQFPKDLAPV